LLKVLGILGFLLKPQKNSLQQVGKTTWQFCELGKILPSLGKYAKSSITWHHVYPNLSTSFANLLETQFYDFGKIPRMPSFLPSPNSKLLEKTYFFYFAFGFKT